MRNEICKDTSNEAAMSTTVAGKKGRNSVCVCVFRLQKHQVCVLDLM